MVKKRKKIVPDVVGHFWSTIQTSYPSTSTSVCRRFSKSQPRYVRCPQCIMHCLPAGGSNSCILSFSLLTRLTLSYVRFDCLIRSPFNFLRSSSTGRIGGFGSSSKIEGVVTPTASHGWKVPQILERATSTTRRSGSSSSDSFATTSKFLRGRYRCSFRSHKNLVPFVV